LVAKKKLAILVLIVLLASLGAAVAMLYETNIIPPLISPPNTMVLKVASASMEPTIKQGNYILVNTSVKPSDINTNYPNSDIIVFRNPLDPSSGYIAHRVISATVVNGTVYFMTKGDANGNPYPQTPQTGLDPWDYNTPPGVSQDLVVGKVVNTNYK